MRKGLVECSVQSTAHTQYVISGLGMHLKLFAVGAASLSAPISIQGLGWRGRWNIHVRLCRCLHVAGVGHTRFLLRCQSALIAPVSGKDDASRGEKCCSNACNRHDNRLGSCLGLQRHCLVRNELSGGCRWRGDGGLRHSKRRDGLDLDPERR